MKHGLLNLKMNGDVMAEVIGDFVYTLSGTMAEAIEGEGENPVVGFSEKNRVPRIKGKVSIPSHLKATDVTDFEGDLTLELRGGKVVALYGGRNVSGSEVTVKDGSVEIDFVGTKCEEIR